MSDFQEHLTKPIGTSSDQLQGFIDQDNHVKVFLGIPFAEAPVGPLRFKPTVELDTPNERRLCIKHAPAAPAAPQTALPI